MPAATYAVGEVAGGGTAFAVSPVLAITARHATGATGTPAEVTIAGRAWPGKVAADDPVLDAALIQFDGPLPAGLRLLRLSDEVAALDPFRAPGYPALPDLDRDVSQLTVSGEITSLAVPLDDAVALQLTVRQAAAGQPLSLHGLSGAPVLAGPDDLVVGIIRWNPEQDDVAIGGICLATPAWALVQLWPDRLADAFVRPGLAARLRTPLRPGGQLPLPADLDLVSLGAMTGAPDPAGQQDAQFPYVPRTCDAELDAACSDQARSCVLISGEPRAGKTRSAIEAIRRNCQADRIAVPIDWAALAAIAATDAKAPLTEGRIVWFLDEIDRYLESGAGPMAQVLKDLLSRPGRTLLVATVRSDRLAAMLATEGGLEPQRADALRLVERASGGRHTVPRLADPAELAAARLAYPRETFTESVGIAERLGRADEMRHQYLSAAPARLALVQAAVDWQRTGRGVGVRASALHDWFAAYLTASRPFADAGDESYRQALDWATSPLYQGASRLALLQLGSGPPDPLLAADDYLSGVDDGLAGDQPRPVPGLAWDLSLRSATPEDCLMVGYAALARAQWQQSARAARLGRGPGLLGTPWSVARWIVFGGDTESIGRYLGSQRAAAERGDWQGYYNQAVHATTTEDLTALMEQAVRTADRPADQAFLLHLLGLSCWFRDDVAAAVGWWRQAAKREPGPDAAGAALLAATCLDPRERSGLLRAAAGAGPAWAAAADAIAGVHRDMLGPALVPLLAAEDRQVLEFALTLVETHALRSVPNDPEAALLMEEVARYELTATAQTFGDLSKQLDARRGERWYRIAITWGQTARLDPAAHQRFVPFAQAARAEGAAAYNLGNLCMTRNQAPLARWAYAHAIDTGAMGSFLPTAIEAAAQARRRVGFPATSRWVVSAPYPVCPFCRYGSAEHRYAYDDA